MTAVLWILQTGCGMKDIVVISPRCVYASEKTYRPHSILQSREQWISFSPVLTHLLAQLLCFAPNPFSCEHAQLTANISTISTGREVFAWRCCQWMVYLLLIPMAPVLWVLTHRPHLAGVARVKSQCYESFPPGCGNEVGLQSESWRSIAEWWHSPRKRPSGQQVTLRGSSWVAITICHPWSLKSLFKIVSTLSTVYLVCKKLCFS